MFSHFQNIEKLLISSGKKITFKERESIVRQGDQCNSILYLPEKTRLVYNNAEIELEEGIFLNVKEFFSNEPFKNTITTIHKTHAILLDNFILEKIEISKHLFNLFFLQKLSQQVNHIQAKFE